MSKKVKGNDKKDKKNKEKVVVGPTIIPEVSENHKEFYIKQIRDLEHRVTTYQRYCDELDVSNAENQIRLDRMLDDQNDIVHFIENKLASKAEEIKEVTKTYKALQEAIVTEDAQFNGQLQAIQEEHAEMEANLTKENELLKNKLLALEESEKNRDNLSSEIKQLEMELFNQESEHRDARYLLDKQSRTEKDKLKIEMLEQVKLVANEYKEASNEQLSETSKRTIREMVAINDKLQKMSGQTLELVDANEVLNYRVAEQKTKIKILEESEKKLIRKNVCNHHTLSLLKSKCQSLEPEVMMAVVETKDRIEELMAEKNQLTLQLKQYRTQLVENQEQNRNYAREKEDLKETVKEKQLLRSELKKLIMHSAIAIEEVIKPTDTKSCIGVDGSESFLLKREQVLEALLVLMNSANLETHSTSVYEKSRSESSNLDPDGSDEEVNTKIYQIDEEFSGLAKKHMQNIPEYKIGYLGLVPKRSLQFSQPIKPLATGYRLQATSKTASAVNGRDLCSKYSFANKSAPVKTKTTLPRLPSKVLRFAEELITTPRYKGMNLFPNSYLMEKDEGGMMEKDEREEGGVMEKAQTTKSAISDKMWMS